MQICQLTAAEADRVPDPGFVPDCHFHKHLSKRDADQAAADGKVRFVNRRAVVALGPALLSGYWYDKVAKQGSNDRYWGVAWSGRVRTKQLVNFMPRGMKHKVKDVGACGAHGRLMTAKAVNDVSPATNRVGDQK
jgi:hypothetical protein